MKTNRDLKKTITLVLIIVLKSPVFAGPDNIAPLAKVKASSCLSDEYVSANIIDNCIHMDQYGEWASNSGITFWGEINFPWIEMQWNETRAISRIVLFDRPSLETHLAGGRFHFSDGSRIDVFQIPNDGSPKVVNFPSKHVDWIRFEAMDGKGEHLGLSEIQVFPAPEEYPDYISWVDPYIETTRGRYIFFITGNQPYGMISAAPLTRNKNQQGGGYNYNSEEVLGFPQIHGWMLSGLDLMPTTGKVDPTKGEQYWKSKFSHDDEIVQPGYHKMYLEDYGIWLEQTTGERVSFYKFEYTRDDVSNILFNLGGYLATSTMTDAVVHKVNDHTIEGEFITVGRLWGGPDKVKIYFVAEFDKPFEQLDGWADQLYYPDINDVKGASGSTPQRISGWSYHDAPTSGVSAKFSVKKTETLQLKMAVSYTSLENAHKNLESELLHWDFDRARKSARDEWNEWLGKIRVEGGTEAQKIKFYTDLWHVLLGRHKIDDANGDYPDYTEGNQVGSHTIGAKFKLRTLPRDNNGQVKYHMYNSDAFWLTQWNLNILLGLAWPEMLDEFSASLVQYADNGGLLPRGPNVGGYSYIMTGCPATSLISSAYQKGLLSKVDTWHAYETMKRNHMPGGMQYGGLGVISEEESGRGYNAGITIETCFQDWALAQMAEDLEKKEDYKFFSERADDWQKLFHPKHKLIFPKDKHGNWLHEEGLSGKGWVESNSWQGTWSVSHDIETLAELMGGNDSLCGKLDYAFRMAVDNDFVFGYGGGYISYANQPGCSNAHVFNHAGKPWLSQYWVRRVNEQAYGSVSPDKGYGGHDEDQGQMGGVSALMSLGIFSLKGTNSSEPEYDITAPVFDKITISLDSDYYQGDQFEIITHNNSVENCYIQKISLNNNTKNSPKFLHADFEKGGKLEIWLDDKPNFNIK
jgi:predicted alpha-1,2-mannosidase